MQSNWLSIFFGFIASSATLHFSAVFLHPRCPHASSSPWMRWGKRNVPQVKNWEKSFYYSPFPSVTTSDLLPRLIKKWVNDPYAPGNSGPNPLNCLAVQSSLPLTSPGNSTANPYHAPPSEMIFTVINAGGRWGPCCWPVPQIHFISAACWGRRLTGGPAILGSCFSLLFLLFLWLRYKPVAAVLGKRWIKVVLKVPQICSFHQW